MKITAIVLLKTNGDNDPIILGESTDLTTFGYFQRSSVKEFIIFVARTIAKRTPPGQRQSVEHEAYLVHSFNKNGLCGLVFADSAYPTRSAFSVINKVLDEYLKVKGDLWQSVKTDCKEPLPFLDESVTKYQDPKEADKFLKIQKELDETKIILHKTIESVLARGEKLDSLVDKSNDLSIASQMFYKQAKKSTSCCSYL